MKGRVIKFNLVGAICVLILIIVIIVFAISMLGIKDKKEENTDKGNNEEQVAEKNTEPETNIPQIDERKEYTEIVLIEGKEQPIIMRVCKGSYGYSMKYDVNAFYVEKDKNNADEFNSLYSDTINILVKEIKGDFNSVKADILTNQSNSDGNIVNISEQLINGMYSIRKNIRNNNGISYVYYLSKDDKSYFTIEVNVGSEFEKTILPIVEKMVSSFEIL